MHKSAAIITLLALLAAFNSGVRAAFSHTPESATEYLGVQATFTCITDGSHFLYWTVDGVEARFPVVRNRGITFVHSGVNSEASNLTILASLQNNNSEIICIQQNLLTGQEIARTSPVYLYVQGLLDPPSNVAIDFKNETVIHLTWLPPFSLKDMSGYAVTISTESDNEIIIDESQTTFTEFTFQWRSSFGYCQNRYIFQVAAANNLGAGNKTNGIVAGFLRSYIEASPSSQTARPGQWVNFTCGIQCSQADLMAWFLNGSTLSLLQDTGLNFQRYPQYSYCGTSQTIGIENHTLSLMTNYDLGWPLMVDCVLISGCREGIEDSPSYTCTCSSESAHFKLQGTSISIQETHSQNTATSADTPHLKKHIILFGTSLGLGALLLVLLTLFVTTVILMWYCHRNKMNSIRFLERESKVQEAIYDIPAVVVQPTAINELEMENYHLDESMVPTALQHCPAYETASCIKR